MSSRIRTKLLRAFMMMLIPLAALIIISLYNQKTIHRASYIRNIIVEELTVVGSLQLALA
ncbi:MAG: hypothetical protein HY954_04565 [Deltaproteobacteria bacterium]|nr:hypothetical protein [Deltaproteobacteria bacterium]